MKVMQIMPKDEAFCSNSYCMVGNDGSCGIVDPGMHGDEIANICLNNSLEVTHILLTHGHFDHIGGVYHLKKAYPKASIVACDKEADIIADPMKNLVRGVPQTLIKEMYSLTADILVKDGDVLVMDGEEVKVIETPGHTKGSVCYLVGDDIFTGDTLFFHSYGRSDLYSGNQQELMKSLLKFDQMPDQVRVFPGHNETCTMADNRGFLKSIKTQRGI